MSFRNAAHAGQGQPGAGRQMRAERLEHRIQIAVVESESGTGQFQGNGPGRHRCSQLDFGLGLAEPPEKQQDVTQQMVRLFQVQTDEGRLRCEMHLDPGRFPAPWS